MTDISSSLAEPSAMALSGAGCNVGNVRSKSELNDAYKREYLFCIEVLEDRVDEEDYDLIEDSIQRLDEHITSLKEDMRIHDVLIRNSYLEDDELRHYRQHFVNLKRAIEAKFAELKGIEAEQRGKIQHINAIKAQISALKVMKEQINVEIDTQIDALSRAL